MVLAADGKHLRLNLRAVAKVAQVGCSAAAFRQLEAIDYAFLVLLQLCGYSFWFPCFSRGVMLKADHGRARMTKRGQAGLEAMTRRFSWHRQHREAGGREGGREDV